MLKRVLLISAMIVFGFSVVGMADVVYLGDPVYISTFVPGDGIVVGDKRFSNFTMVETLSNSGNAPDDVLVQPVKVSYEGTVVDDGQGYEYGLHFTGGWSAQGREIVDTLIKFKVTVLDPDTWIVDNTLWMDAGAGANGGQASISETVYDTTYPGPVLAVKYVYHNENDFQLFDHQEYGGLYKEVWVTKDVLVNAGVDEDNGSASISSFYQTFSQIPEPLTMILLSIGGVALAARRRRA